MPVVTDEFNGHGWNTRYAIIKGVCEGLEYLHEGLEHRMFHLHLKPQNILLNKNMVPKIKKKSAFQGSSEKWKSG